MKLLASEQLGQLYLFRLNQCGEQVANILDRGEILSISRY